MLPTAGIKYHRIAQQLYYRYRQQSFVTYLLFPPLFTFTIKSHTCWVYYNELSSIQISAHISQSSSKSNNDEVKQDGLFIELVFQDICLCFCADSKCVRARTKPACAELGGMAQLCLCGLLWVLILPWNRASKLLIIMALVTAKVKRRTCPKSL